MLQRGEVTTVDRGVLGERQRDRRDHVGRRHPCSSIRLEELVEVEARHRHHVAALAQPHVHDHRHPVDVEERERRRSTRRRSPSGIVALGLQHVRDQVAVAQHHALGQPGGPATSRGCTARSVAGSISTSGASPPSSRRSRMFVSSPSASPTTMMLVGVDPDRGRGLPRRLQERADGEQHLRARVLELMGELVGCVEGVRGRVRGAGADHAVEDQRVLREVRHVDRDDVALADAAGCERRRERPGAGVELRVGDRPAAWTVDQGGLVAELGRPLERERAEVLVGDLGCRGCGQGLSPPRIGAARRWTVRAYRSYLSRLRRRASEARILVLTCLICALSRSEIRL